jgi:uncharacterized protein
MSAEAPDRLLASPCIGVCHLDPALGWCTGCGRDLAEIGRWRDLESRERAVIWQHLAVRMARMGQAWVLQPWPPETVHGHLAAIMSARSARLLVRGDGGWTKGSLPMPVHPALRVFKGRDGLALAMPRCRLPDAEAGSKNFGLLPALPESYEAVALVLTGDERGACLPARAR